ncbi:YqaA family protein [Pseudorhodoplanes sp.]|uniref:YqaA family protein n=1 Tax=Pseudorhodoplanes sp. TaxID=1934341 RepID=UPI002B760A44|nr:YqaA family protein [Pseudorhodoplanes sp.]HWV41487.1 YqaA family protein [Pseudorhodoplanes sp.]
MTALTAYAGLFAVAFIAATILPAQSEVALVGLLLSGQFSPWLLIAVASAGNILGSCVNWLVGGFAERFRDRKWFPVSPRALDKAQGWYHRYGRWSLLLSWVPVIGDPLTVAAGFLREPFWSFLILVSIAKTARYLLLVFGAMGVMSSVV